jgi:hypothetical protein
MSKDNPSAEQSAPAGVAEGFPDNELDGMLQRALDAEGPEGVRIHSMWIAIILNFAVRLHETIQTQGDREQVVTLLRRLERCHPLYSSTDSDVTRRLMRARAVPVPYWPWAAVAKSAHEAAALSSHNLLVHIREASGLPSTGRVDWGTVRLAAVRKRLASLPPFDVQRLTIEMHLEADLAVSRWQAEPAVARADYDPTAGDWESAPGQFRYLANWHDLTGQRLDLLAAFVKACHMTLTNHEISRACSKNYESNRPAAYVSELNRALCTLLSVTEKPIRPIPRGKAYRLYPPALCGYETS